MSTLLESALDCRPFNFARVNGVGASGNLSSAGSKVITITRMPFGLAVGKYVYISGGSGTAEAVAITAVSGAGGADTGSVTVTTANIHSGAWTIQSATAGIQEAISSAGSNPVAVTMPDGSYTIHGPITLPINSAVGGGAMWGTVLNVATDFPLSVNGVFIGPNFPGNGPQITNLTVSFTQPDSTDILQYKHWPPAFYMVDSARFLLENILVIRAWDGINMTGNSGGAIINNFQISHFGTGINIDGALDSVYLDRVRFWPYGLTSNQSTLFFTSTNGTVGLLSGRCDDIHVTDFITQNPTGVHFYQSALGVTSGHINGASFDTNSQFVYEQGFVNVANISFSIAVFDKSAILMSGGVLRVTTGFYFPGVTPGSLQPWVKQTGGVLQLTNSWFWSGAIDHSIVAASAGELILTGNYFNRAANTSYTAATIAVTSTARVTAIGNRTLDKGTGTGNLISVATDNWNQVRGNIGIGWGYSLPATITTGIYETDSLATMRGITASTMNWIASETGTNNAIAGNLVGASFAEGQQVYIVLAHTLQAGANTFALNGGSAVSIKKHTNTASDLTIAYAVGAVIHLLGRGGVWLDMAQ